METKKEQRKADKAKQSRAVICPNCGHVMHPQGALCFFRCPNCGNVLDRCDN